MHKRLKQVQSILKFVFNKSGDHKGIDAVMKDKYTERFLIEHKSPEANKLKILGCIVFRAFEKLLFDEFVLCIGLQESVRLTSLNKTLISKKYFNKCFDKTLDGDC